MKTRMKTTLIAFLLAALASVPLLAHEGHDHGDEKAALPNLGNTPQRQPDGVVFLPKAAQRLLGVRTRPLAAGEHARSLELNGRVIVDPRHGGQVQAMQAGRVEAPAGGVPLPGSAVRKGAVLAWLTPASGQIERAGQTSQLAELKAARALAERRLVRLQELADTVPGREIEAAQSELASLTARVGAIGAGLSGREALVAPVSGMVAAVNAAPGQIVAAGELVFEIVDPDSMHVEALSYAVLPAADIVSASVAAGSDSLPLDFLGAGQRLREQALPLLFGRRDPGLGLRLPLGQPVTVQVQLRGQVKGWAVPRQAVVRSPANEAMVWVKTAPERFTPKPIRSEALDGAQVLVVDGLADGDRVVVDGASLINQIR
jgi:hypothetical protein